MIFDIKSNWSFKGGLMESGAVEGDEPWLAFHSCWYFRVFGPSLQGLAACSAVISADCGGWWEKHSVTRSLNEQYLTHLQLPLCNPSLVTFLFQTQCTKPGVERENALNDSLCRSFTSFQPFDSLTSGSWGFLSFQFENWIVDSSFNP